MVTQWWEVLAAWSCGLLILSVMFSFGGDMAKHFGMPGCLSSAIILGIAAIELM